MKDTLNTLGKVRDHLYGNAYRDVLRQCRERIGQVEVDRLRVKPMVKITGEFWAQLTEGDGNFNMFAFLEARRRARAGGFGRQLDHVPDAPGKGQREQSQGPRCSIPTASLVGLEKAAAQ